MDMALKQEGKLSQTLVMTPQLQQAIKLLQLSRLELVDKIRQEVEENPVLEEIIEGEEKNVPEERESAEMEKLLQKAAEDYYEPRVHRDTNDRPSFDNFISKNGSLYDHLLFQLQMSAMTEPEEAVGQDIIGNIDTDGYLRADMGEIARNGKMDEAAALKVLRKIQEFDPIGVASRDLQECLLIQTWHLGLRGTLVEKIVQGHLKSLETKNYHGIARECGVTLEAVHDAVRVISHMEPKPGRQYGGDDPSYVIPEVFVMKDGENYVIVLNDDGIPTLRISQFYRAMLKDKANADAKQFIQEKLRSAHWLIKSIHQRQRTIYRVTESIIKHQRDFLDRGISFLKPLVLRDVAQDVGLHESTVSRVTSNKYVHTPQGLFEMKFFFNTGINRSDGQSVASESVKESIRAIIAAEDPRKPLSDQQIVQILKGTSVSIARRTVTKYREAMHILPSSSRKKIL